MNEMQSTTVLHVFRPHRVAAGIALGAMLLAWLSLQQVSPVMASPTQQGGESSSCTDLEPETGFPLSTRVITPSHIRQCETAAVSATIRVSCGSVPLHIVLVLDRSGSMVGEPIQDVREAARELVNTLNVRENPTIQVGIVSHGGRPSTDLRLTNSVGQILGRIGSLDVRPNDIEDNLPAAITAAKNLLTQERRNHEVAPVDVMVVLSDGGQTYAPIQAVGAAGQAKGQDILVVSVCIENGTPGGCAAMRQVASSSRYYFSSRGTTQVVQRFREIAETVTDIYLRTMEIIEYLPDGLDYVPDSAVPEAEWDPEARSLRWDLRFISKSGVEIGYRVAPSEVTTYTVASPSEVEYRDTRSAIGRMRLPTAVLTVTERCVPPPPETVVVPPTVTDTPRPTSTATPSATPTEPPSPTPTVLPTATPSPTPGPIYLPILNLRRCLERDIPVDIVLIVDASTSMRTRTAAGRPRIEAAQDGARRFTELLRPVDHAAILAFNQQTYLLSGLSGDRGALASAIDRIETAPYTRIDLALDAARAELIGARARPDVRKVVVLLTDGQPTQTTPEAVRQAGARLGVFADRFVIGVGGDIDVPLMIDVAGAADRYYPVDDAEALERIYTEIAERTVCEDP